MIEDDVVREVRAVREAYARSHNYDVQAMVEDLRASDAVGDWPVVRHPPRPLRTESRKAADVSPNKPMQPTGSAGG